MVAEMPDPAVRAAGVAVPLVVAPVPEGSRNLPEQLSALSFW